MSDPRLDMLADLLVNYSFELKPGQKLAAGEGFLESGIHEDMLCDMHDGEVRVDGELFYQAGKPVAW